MTKFETSKVVPNTGSTARDHLANERTLLAWVRTSIAMIALGIAITKFSHGQDQRQRLSGGIVGACLTSMGVFYVVYSRMRYMAVAKQLEAGLYLIHTGGVDLTLGILVVVAFFLQLVVIVFSRLQLYINIAYIV